MSVYSGERYLRDSVESILNQSFSDFEFIIVDDGSTDSSSEILESYAAQDERLRLLRNASNLGLTRSLNKGLELACGEYVARQDADDISLPERFMSQVRFLGEHPEIGVVGSWITNIDETGQRDVCKTPTSSALIGWTLLFSNCMAHPSIMFRRSLVRDGVFYRPEITYGQDYDLWARISSKTKLANLPECLVFRRKHQRAISTRHDQEQAERAKAVAHENIARLLREAVPQALVWRLWDASHGQALEKVLELRQVTNLYLRLYRAYVTHNILDRVECRDVACDLSSRLTRIGLKHVNKWPADAIRVLWEGILLSRRIPANTYLAELLQFVKTFSVLFRLPSE